MIQVEKLAEILRAELEGKRVIELACGSGVFSAAAAKYAEAVFCVDLDESRLNKTVGSLNNVSFLRCDATKLPFPNGSFDLAVLYNSFYHVKDVWPQIFQESKRVLKDGGNLLIISSWKLTEQKVFRSRPTARGNRSFPPVRT